MINLPEFLTNPNPEVYLGENYVIFDFETTTIGKGLALYPDNRAVCVAWRCGPGHPSAKRRGGTPYLYQRDGEYGLNELVRDIEEADFCVAHNAKFDLQWAARAGLDLTKVLVYDTMVGEYVIGGNRWVLSGLSLDAIIGRRFGDAKLDIIRSMWNEGIGTEDIPDEWLRRYCVQDLRLTERLFLSQRRELQVAGLLPVLYSRCLLTPVLADIEHNGMQLDAEAVTAQIKELEGQYASSQQKLSKLAPINFASTLQLSEYLYGENGLGFDERKRLVRGKWVPDRTPSDRPKTDVDTILSLKAKSGPQLEFLGVYGEYRENHNQLTKYIRKFDDCCKEADGRLTATLNQCNTRTQRLSSTGLDYNAQFQNFPRQYKPLFKARRPGWLIGEADGAQLEFRVAVHLGRDSVGLFDIVHDVDIHSVTASVIWPDIAWDGKTKHPMRQPAKPHTFKPLYGGQSGTEDEKRYYKFFREKYGEITNAQDRWKDVVLESKKLTTEWGLVYYWPDTTMDRGGYIRNSTAICNYPVQAFATAEIIPLALVWFWHRLKRSGLEMFIINTVHDSIVVELPESEIEAFHELSKQTLIDDVYYMLEKLYDIRFTVPLGAGITTGLHWGAKEETKYEGVRGLWWDAANDAGMCNKIV